MTAITNQLWGVRANLVADVVAEHGSVRALAWSGRNLPRYERIRARWGPSRTHLVSAVISLDNGCSYTAHSHIQAFQLHYFRDSQQVFPMSVDDLLALSRTDRDTLVGALAPVLEAANLDDERAWIQRALEIKNGAPLEDSADEDIQRLIDLLQWLNDVGIKAATEFDEAHDPINKDVDLRAPVHHRPRCSGTACANLLVTPSRSRH